MKVEEAKRKECRQMPAFMQSTSDANLIDAGSVQFIPSRCTANECMAWRWFGRMSDEGYCGLAGKEGAE